MASIYTYARECQLLRNDVEDLLSLPAYVVLSTARVTDAETASLAATPVGAAESLLTGAHVRDLAVDALVRMAIPKRRQPSLLDSNKFVQAFLQSRASKRDTADTAGHVDEAKNKEAPMVHRVGRLVAIVQRPGAATDAVANSLGSWLIAVHYGECVELLSATQLSSEPFTEEEHLIYVQSTLGMIDVPSSVTGAAHGPAETKNRLLSGEQAQAVRQKLATLRRAARLVLDPPSETVQRFLEAMTAGAQAAVRGHKHPRDEPTSTTTVGAHELRTSESNEGPAGLAQYPTNGETSEQVRIARLKETVRTQASQLQHLRQLLHSKDGEVKHHVQLQRQSELEHANEVDRWRAKVEEGQKVQEQLQKEATAKLQEKDRLLEEANTKLRHLAAMTVKYKKVSDTLAKRLAEEGESGLNGPEEVLGALMKRTSL